MRPQNFLLTGLMVFFSIWMLSVFSIAADASGMQITSSAFSNESAIPIQFTCSGANQSPPLSWSDVPQGTKSLALIVDDPDAPIGTFVHWVVYDIPPSSTGFKEGTVEGNQGSNGMGKASYMGPCPPPGKPHHYHFQLFALDSTLNLETGAKPQAVRDAMKDHVKGSAELVGIFSR